MLMLILFGFILLLANCQVMGDTLKSTEESECFQLYQRYQLIRLNRRTVNSTSRNDCLRKCMAAPLKFDFVCFSVLYYPNVQQENCILNVESRQTRPDLFKSVENDPNNNVVYFDNLCAPGKIANATVDVAVANMTTVADSKVGGYFTISQMPNQTSGLGSLFMLSKALPDGNYSLRITDALACSNQITSPSSPVNAARYKEVGQLQTDSVGNLVAGPTTLSQKISLYGGSDEVLGKAVLLVPSGSNVPVACGVLIGLAPWSAAGQAATMVVSTSLMNLLLLALAVALYYAY